MVIVLSPLALWNGTTTGRSPHDGRAVTVQSLIGGRSARTDAVVTWPTDGQRAAMIGCLFASWTVRSGAGVRVS
jgi:hypothetical protein